MNYSKIKITQISIFILIAIMIIFLIVFLINTDVNTKKEVIEKNKDTLNSNSDSNIINLKDNIDSCMEKELKKALIIAGAKGGFIYENNEYSFPGVLPINVYPNTFLANLGLTSNYLSKNTLVYTSELLSIPKLEDKSFSKFNDTIKQEMEKFILNEFMMCIDIEGMKDRGYTVIYDEFSGKVIRYDLSENIYVDGIIGKVNDSVKLDVFDKSYYGNIVDVDTTLKRTKVKFNSSLSEISVAYESLNVVNINSTTKLEVIFQDETVILKLNFPITISKGNFSSSYKNSEVSVNVRFKKLLELSENIISYKYYKNHSLNITNPTTLNQFINGEIGEGIPYFKNTENKNIQIIKTIHSNSDEYKAEVYTIIDFDSKILGEPYIFNFGYENRAPVMSLSNLNGINSNVDNNNILLIVSKNKQVSYNLRDITKDPQVFDNNYNGGIDNVYYFKEQHYSSSDAKFDLYKNGTLYFIGFAEKSFTYNIVVTDNEAKSEYTFQFVVGFPDNKNNVEAINCFKFQPFNDNAFPIDNRIKGIRDFVDSAGKTKLYAYKTYIDPSTGILGNSELSFGRGCVFDPSKYSVKYNINGVDKGTLNSPFVIDISSSVSTVQNIKVNLIDSSGNSVMTEPYEISIYPASCLGPATDDSTITNLKTAGAFGTGSGTCCDISSILTSISSNTPSAFVGSSNLKNSGLAANPEMYFTFSLDSSLTTSGLQDNVIWDSFGDGATSLYSASIISSCQGSFPRFQENIQSVQSTGTVDLSGNIVAYSNSNYQRNGVSLPISLKKINSGGRCIFSEIGNKSDFKILVRANGIDIPMVSGFASLNSNTFSGPIPLSGEGSNTLALCSNNWFISTDGANWVSSGLVGLGGSSGSVYKSKGYCYRGSTTCSGRTDSPTFAGASDVISTCSDIYLNLNNGVNGVNTFDFSQASAPTNWQCLSGTTIISCKNSTNPAIYNLTISYMGFCSGSSSTLCDGNNNCNSKCPSAKPIYVSGCP